MQSHTRPQKVATRTEHRPKAHLDDHLRLAAIRLVRERSATAEGICIAFGISHSVARSLVKRALINAK